MKFFILGLAILLLFAHKSMGQTGIISTIAGNGYPHDTGDGRAATAAALAFPFFCEFDAIGNFYFSARANHTVRKITPLGVISTIAGIGIAGYSGDGGPASAAKLNNPYGIAIDSFNNVYIAEVDGSRIRKIDAISGIITTYAGNGSVLDTGDGGHSSTAALGYPALLCFDSNYNLYFTSGYYRIRKIDRATGIVTHFAGTGVSGYAGDGGLRHLPNSISLWVYAMIMQAVFVLPIGAMQEFERLTSLPILLPQLLEMVVAPITGKVFLLVPHK